MCRPNGQPVSGHTPVGVRPPRQNQPDEHILGSIYAERQTSVKEKVLSSTTARTSVDIEVASPVLPSRKTSRKYARLYAYINIKQQRTQLKSPPLRSYPQRP